MRRPYKASQHCHDHSGFPAVDALEGAEAEQGDSELYHGMVRATCRGCLDDRELLCNLLFQREVSARIGPFERMPLVRIALLKWKGDSL